MSLPRLLAIALAALAASPAGAFVCPLLEPEANATIATGTEARFAWSREGFADTVPTIFEVRAVDIPWTEWGTHTETRVLFRETADYSAIFMLYYTLTFQFCSPLETPFTLTGSAPAPTPTPAAGPAPALDPDSSRLSSEGYLSRDGAVAFLPPLYIANRGEGPLTVHEVRFPVNGVALRIDCASELPLVVPPGEGREIFFAIHADLRALDRTTWVIAKPQVLTDEPGLQRSGAELSLLIVPTGNDVPTATPTPTPTPAPSGTPTPTATPTPTVTPTPTPTATPTCPDHGGDGVIDAADARGCPATVGLLMGN